MTTETSQDEIIMTIYSSQGKNQNRISIKKGLLWEEVKKIIRSNGYNIDSMRAIESTRKAVLEHPKAVVPDTNFNLHLYPVQSKGGAKTTFDRKAIVASIKNHIAVHGDKAKKFFNEDKNITNKTSEELDKLLSKWEKKHGTVTEDDIASTESSSSRKTVKGTVKKQDEAEYLAKQAKETVADTPAMAIKTSLHLLRGITGHENQTNIEQAITQLEKSLITKPTPTEQELLEEEHKELASGLVGIVR